MRIYTYGVSFSVYPPSAPLPLANPPTTTHTLSPHNNRYDAYTQLLRDVNKKLPSFGGTCVYIHAYTHVCLCLCLCLCVLLLHLSLTSFLSLSPLYIHTLQASE